MNLSPGRAFLFLSAILLAAVAPRAQDADSSERDEDSVVSAHKKIHAIPYPNGAMYVNRGISGSFMGGKHRNLGEDQGLFQWQGELSYFYTDWLSGGFGFKITAGEPYLAEQKIFNRYFAHIRFHKAWESASLYVGPQVGVGNLNLLTDSTSDTSSTSNTKTALGGRFKKIANTKPTLGLDLGGGWMFSRYVGFTLGNHLEYSFVDEDGVGVYNALNLHVNPGFSLDIMAFTDSLRKLVSAFYVSVELQTGYLIFEKRGHREDHAEIIGIGLAF